MKRSQMEIMGLAIIVILLSLGMLFVIKFVLLKPPTSVKEEYKQSELAANFLNALMDTNSPECNNIKFSTLFQDCATYAPNGNIYCTDKYSCQYIYEKTKEILQGTFDQWKVKYYFVTPTVITDPIGTNILRQFGDIGTPCQGDTKAKFQPLPSNPPITLALYICS